MKALSIPNIVNQTLTSNLPAVLLLAGALNGFIVRVIEAWQLSGTSALFFGISPFELIAIAVAAILYLEADDRAQTGSEHDQQKWALVPGGLQQVAGPIMRKINNLERDHDSTKNDLAPGLAEMLFLTALLVPSSTVSWIATFLYAIFHAKRSYSNVRYAALLFAALSICSIWSSVIMKWIAIPVTNLEANIVWQVISYLRSDLMLNGNIIGIPDGHRIVLLIACTTLYGLPKAALGYTAISLYLGQSNYKTLLKGLGATLIFYGLANLIRLIAMTWSDTAFHIAHGPIGANIFDGLTTAVVFFLAFLTVEKNAPNQSLNENQRHA